MDPVKLCFAHIDIVYSQASTQERDALKEALIAASIPHWFNSEIIAHLLETSIDKASFFISQLSYLPIIEPFPARGEDSLNIHEKSRLLIRKYLLTKTPSKFTSLSHSAALFFSEQNSAHYKIEQIYHKLAAQAESAADELELLFRNFVADSQSDHRSALVGSIEELEETQSLPDAARAVVLCCIGFYKLRIGAGEALDDIGATALRLAEQADRPIMIAEAKCLIGDIASARGDMLKALESYEDFSILFDQIVAQNAENSLWTREQAIAKSKLASFFETVGRFQDSKDHFEQSNRIIEGLISKYPERQGFVAELGMGKGSLGNLLRKMGKIDNALTLLNEAVEQIEGIYEASNLDLSRDLGVLYTWRADAFKEHNKRKEALDDYRKSFVIFNHLISNNPHNRDWQAHYGVTCANIAQIIFSEGNIQEARKNIDKYLKTFTHLHLSDPKNIKWSRELAVAHWDLSKLCQAQGRRRESLDHAKSAVAILTSLTESCPEVVDFKSTLKTIRLYKTRLFIQ